MLHAQNAKSSGGPTALVYITIGALMSVWSGVWFAWERSRDNATKGVDFICAGLLMTGIALLIIGFFLGRMAHKAHSVEMAQEAAKTGAIQQEPAIAHKL